MRVFVASLATETNTFSPIPTDLAAFKESFYAPPGMHPETPTLCSAPLVVAPYLGRDRAAVAELVRLCELASVGVVESVPAAVNVP